MEYKVEKVKMPTERRIYPFSIMKVGESFLFDNSERTKISSSSTVYGKRKGMKFSIRKEGNDKCRCFRIK
jgi:hypothetical protein